MYEADNLSRVDTGCQNMLWYATTLTRPSRDL